MTETPHTYPKLEKVYVLIKICPQKRIVDSRISTRIKRLEQKESEISKVEGYAAYQSFLQEVNPIQSIPKVHDNGARILACCDNTSVIRFGT